MFSEQPGTAGSFQRTTFLKRQRPSFETGQPIYETRPNLVKAGDLTPGIPATEYYKRRLAIMSRLPPNSCFILASHDISYASGAVFYPFQQDTDFYYLSGWNEPDSVLVLEKDNSNSNEVLVTMFVPEKDKFTEKWNGARTGTRGSKDIFNADEAHSITQLKNILPNIVKRNENVYFNSKLDNGRSSKTSILTERIIYDNMKDYGRLKSCKRELAQIRKIKSANELHLMRQIGCITGKTFNQAIAKRFRNERTLAAYLDCKFISGGCDGSAYVPVVATGSNALCIHYTQNNDVMYDDEMVLVDAAGMLGGYRADVSRTWPVSGRFTDPQRDLYQAVLNVQKKCIEFCRASLGMSLEDIHRESVSMMRQEIKNVGISEAASWNVEQLYCHYVGHNLGLDVHDVPEVLRSEPLEMGQVITIEPGLYIPDDPKFPEYFRNVGIRIEDDIAVGKDTYVNLSVEAVKELADLESIMRNGKTLARFDDDVVNPLESGF